MACAVTSCSWAIRPSRKRMTDCATSPASAGPGHPGEPLPTNRGPTSKGSPSCQRGGTKRAGGSGARMASARSRSSRRATRSSVAAMFPHVHFAMPSAPSGHGLAGSMSGPGGPAGPGASPRAKGLTKCRRWYWAAAMRRSGQPKKIPVASGRSSSRSPVARTRPVGSRRDLEPGGEQSTHVHQRRELTSRAVTCRSIGVAAAPQRGEEVSAEERRPDLVLLDPPGIPVRPSAPPARLRSGTLSSSARPTA